jgi:carboxyl-terminal processing protease
VKNTTTPRHPIYRFSLVAILGVAVLGSTVALSQRDYSFFDPLVDVKSIVAKRFVAEVDEPEMQRAAIRGMIEALNDPYTTYIPPADVAEFNKGLTGDFVGVGMQVMTRDGWLTVVTPLEDTPAFRAGVMAEDRIVEIDGQSTFGLSADQCVAKLTGKSGTKVSFLVERSGERIPFEVTRERIVTRTVKGLYYEGNGAGANGAVANGGVNGGANGAAVSGTDPAGWRYSIDPGRNIAYIRLTQFTPSSAEDVKQTLLTLGAGRPAGEGGLGGLILDLRFNPGGTMQDAEEIADLFLREGTIVSTRGRAHQDRITRAQAEGTLPEFPLVVIVNSASASASEIVAGALAENNRAVVVGTRTFGKGSVQTVHSLPANRGQLKITEQRYYLPSGRMLHRSDDSVVWGVDPSDGHYVPLTDEETVEMMRVRRERDIIGARAVDGRTSPGEQQWSEPAWIAERLKDPQLAAALRAIQKRIDSGAWSPSGQPLPGGEALAGADLKRAIQLRERMMREIGRLQERIENLEQAAGPQEEKPPLWAETVNLSGGKMLVYDSSGALITTLSITGADLERMLRDSGAVAPAEVETPTGAETPESEER